MNEMMNSSAISGRSLLLIVAGLTCLMGTPTSAVAWLSECVAMPETFQEQPTQDSTDEAAQESRQRPRALGITLGVLRPGRFNAITDVAGVAVGHASLQDGEGSCTGVTVVLPHQGNLFQEKVPAGLVVGNGFGKFVGISQVQELGVLETPIGLTNTLSTFAVADALIRETLAREGNASVRSVNPVVGECNDGYLNDIRAMNVTADHVRQALRDASEEVVAEGCVGAGTGTLCMGWKGGIGTSSRVLPRRLGGYTVGVLVQTNFGGILEVDGAPVGRELGRYYLQRDTEPTPDRDGDDAALHDTRLDLSLEGKLDKGTIPKSEWEQGSCIVIVATDAPLDARQLTRLAKRALLGLGAVGSSMSHGSGDYVLAFSTAESVRLSAKSSDEQTTTLVRDERLSPMFQAAKEATEEAVLNSLFMATTTQGQEGRTVDALPIDRVLDVCRRYGVLPN